MKRLVPALLAVVLAAPSVHAQERFQALRNAEVRSVPAIEVLERAVDAISTMHMSEFSDSVLWEAAIHGLIEALNDPYAQLFTEVESEEWEEQTTGNYSGIGLQITLLNESVTVTAVFRSTPANDVGIVVGDMIVGVNEHDASNWSTNMAADSIRGPVGSSVLVKIKREGFAEPLEYDITRAEVHVPAVSYGVLDSGIGYAVLDKVARDAAKEMNEALTHLSSTQGLIIDLRGNPGGFLDESLMLADLFLKPGSRLASMVQREPGGKATDTQTDFFDDRWPQLVPDLPLVVLVDRYTASGAEILAGALQDFDRAIVLGDRSFGKGVVQTVMPLPYNRRLRFTTGSWHTPLNRSLQRARDRDGRPIAEDLDTFPRVMTPGGRPLISGGGIFPDLPVRDDTLTTSEQEFLQIVGEKQFPLGLRLAEFGFDVAAELRAQGKPAALADDRFQVFLSKLESEGLPAETLGGDEVRGYLAWRAKITIAQRMDDIGAEADFRMERDPVLTEAVRLLRAATSQTSLNQAADKAAGRTGNATRGG